MNKMNKPDARQSRLFLGARNPPGEKRSHVTQKVKANFFVAGNGNDRWSGKLAEPNAKGTDGPFATLKRARDAVRKIRTKADLREPVAIMLRGGKYFLEETLVLRSQDSGTQDYPITYMNYPGEEPILSGGKRIAGWSPYQEKILQCDLPETKGGIWKFQQLFFNGERQIRARYPNFDPNNPLYRGWLFMEGPADEEGLTAFKYIPGSLPRRWAKPTQADVFAFGKLWGSCRIPIKTVDYENCVITMRHGMQDFHVMPWYTSPISLARIGQGFRFYVENLLEELDQPGEWCLDTEEGKLYFWPPHGSIEETEVVAPVLNCLIELHDASWITISGLTFTETTTGGDMNREGHDGYGIMYPRADLTYCGEALRMKGTKRCRIENNRFFAIGGNAIYVEDYNERNLIQHNEIAYAGHCGVVLIGSKYQLRVTHHPICNEVVDNHIHHCGLFYKWAGGVFLGVSDGNLVAHNLIEHMPNYGINLGSSGYGRNIIEYNELRHTCLETEDNGAIYSWMQDPFMHNEKDAQRSGHLIRYNFIIDAPGLMSDKECHLVSGNNTCGIYLDDFSSNCFIYGNIIVQSEATAGWGIHINGGKNNIIENNVFVDCCHAVMVHDATTWQAPHMAPFVTGNRFSRNICCRTRPSGTSWLSLGTWTDWVFAASDHNLFYNADGGEHTISIDETDHPLAHWKRMGYDICSVFADPLFVDPEHDDYRLRSESPAFKLGFLPIDISQMGMRKRTE